jgi:endoglucanase
MRWAVEGLGAGQYRLRKVTNTRYATLTGGGTGDTATSLNDWLNVNHQKFTFTGNHGPYYSLIFVHSGKALTVYGASMNDNAAIIQYAYNGGNNAQWQFRNP